MIRHVVCGIAMAAALASAVHAQSVPASPVPPHNVLSEDLSEQRRVVTVRVERRLDDQDLQRLAAQVLAQGKRTYARTQLNVFLPGMPSNGVPWASVAVAPEPKITVFGLSYADEQMLLAEHRADHRPLLGAWLTSPPATAGRLAIFSDHGKVYAEWRLRGGQKTVEEVRDSVTKSGRRFDIPGAGFYVLTRAGDLEIWDKQTLIATAERIRPEHLSIPAAIALGPKAPVVVVEHVAPQRLIPAEMAPSRFANTVPQAERDPRPASPVAPEPRVAVRAPAAATAGSIPAVLPKGAMSNPMAAEASAASPAAAAAPATTAAPLDATSRVKKHQSASAKSKALAQRRQTGAENSRHPASQTPGDTISAKLAGRY